MLRLIALLTLLFTAPLLPAAQPQPLPAQQAFTLTGFLAQNKQLVLQWDIAPSYFLYRDKLEFIPSANNQVPFSAPTLPKGEPNQDDIRGHFESYTGHLVVTIPLPTARGALAMVIHYQGCSTQGFCYPPMQQLLHVDLTQVTGPRDLADYLTVADGLPALNSEQNTITQLLTGKHYLFILGSFLILGLLLAFTPCVLPMVPILSSIIIGLNHDRGTRKGFLLSLSYVFGMSLSYALAGVIVALLGSSVQVALQAPWVIVLFSLLFVALALSLFGFYELQLPATLQQKMLRWSATHKGGTYVGVFVMGGLATLIVSPCVSAPLVGVLTYIAQTGDVVLGGAALLMLGLGMGIPLLLVGASAGKMLPKSGAWMTRVKQIFGLLMLGMALFMLARILSPRLILSAWCLLFVASAVLVGKYTRHLTRGRLYGLAVAFILYLYAGLLALGAWQGMFDPLIPLAGLTTSAHLVGVSSGFTRVHSAAELSAQLAQAKQQRQPVLLDFYADWCESCVAMDKHLWPRPKITQALAGYVLLRIDVTHNSEFGQNSMRRFAVVAPPAILFYTFQGELLPAASIVGEVNEKNFLQALKNIAVAQTQTP